MNKTNKTSRWQATPPNPQVKICGLTRPDNALDCVNAGADIIGLVFFPKSPRHVSFHQARDIVQALRPTFRPVVYL